MEWPQQGVKTPVKAVAVVVPFSRRLPYLVLHCQSYGTIRNLGSHYSSLSIAGRSNFPRALKKSCWNCQISMEPPSAKPQNIWILQKWWTAFSMIFLIWFPSPPTPLALNTKMHIGPPITLLNTGWTCCWPLCLLGGSQLSNKPPPNLKGCQSIFRGLSHIATYNALLHGTSGCKISPCIIKCLFSGRMSDDSSPIHDMLSSHHQLH